MPNAQTNSEIGFLSNRVKLSHLPSLAWQQCSPVKKERNSYIHMEGVGSNKVIPIISTYILALQKTNHHFSVTNRNIKSLIISTNLMNYQ